LEEGEGDGTVSGISESVLQDVKKSAIELLAIRSEYPAILQESR
jgi:hypothetical protein